MSRKPDENCVQIIADTIMVDGVPVAVLLEGVPAMTLAAFRRCVDNADFSRRVFRERLPVGKR